MEKLFHLKKLRKVWKNSKQMYYIEFSELAKRKFEKLGRAIQVRIVKKLRQIRAMDNPYRFFEPLKEVSARKARVGNYRIIADIDVKNKKIYVLTIGHRKEIYKKLHKK